MDVGIAEVELPGSPLDETLAFFSALGFRLQTIMPADDPTVAVIAGHGLRLRLDREVVGAPGRVRLITDAVGPQRSIAPNGTVVDVVAPDLDPSAPPASIDAPTFELTRASHGADVVGRAGMHYRDLLPSRQGGRVIASHIVIPEGGPVPDYVHHHSVWFQVIYCRRGWVRVVYEDQGPAFALAEGDCVLQPPHIRHRVLESSPGLEVIEVTCPAVHPTHVDHELALPTAIVRPDRDFGGQRFVRHRAQAAPLRPWRAPGFVARDTGIGDATGGAAGVRAVQSPQASAATPPQHHDGELLIWYVLGGHAIMRAEGRGDEPLGADDAVAVPAGLDHQLVGCSAGFELLEVSLPDQLVLSSH